MKGGKWVGLRISGGWEVGGIKNKWRVGLRQLAPPILSFKLKALGP